MLSLPNKADFDSAEINDADEVVEISCWPSSFPSEE
tara:strand:- start:549 stop:656 length:108 start_codon:yes stop_codon:yes gene_type:complete